MKKQMMAGAAGLVWLSLAGIAAAQTAAPAQAPSDATLQKMQARWKAADKNGDGLIDKAEAEAGLPRLARHFDQLDVNHDGKLSADELRAMAQSRMARRQQ